MKQIIKKIMLKGEKGDNIDVSWGDITGTVASQNDLDNVLNQKEETDILSDVSFSGDYSDLDNKPVFSTVALTGSYNDLSTKPTIPTKISELENDSGFVSTTHLVNKLRPIGSYYWSISSTNPSSLFGGTWEQVKDKMILAAGDIFPQGSVGGEKEHVLTINEMPKHRHKMSVYSGRYYSFNNTTGQVYGFATSSGDYYAGNTKSGYYLETKAQGGNVAHNNMPPYLVAYCFKRVA